MSVPRIIILSPPPKRHINAGSRTEEDRLPVAGRPCHPSGKRGDGDSSSAWNFNFNNGNENWNNLNNSNNNRVFGVRSRPRR